MKQTAKGNFRCGMPYNKFGSGPRPLVIIQGLSFENKPLPGMALWGYSFLGDDFTVYSVLRKPSLPQGCTMQDMADAYAALIRDEFDGPVDVIGVSTGGSIAQPLAASHPDLVRKMVIHSSAYRLSEPGRRVQMEVAQLAQQGQWREAWHKLLHFMYASSRLAGLQSWLLAQVLSIRTPQDASDLVITVEAEDTFNFKERLGQILAPTLVVAGERDPFYTPALFRDTAAGIRYAKLHLYPKMGHPASGKQFEHDVLAFLREEVG